jgi:hypothetical protein
MVEHWYSNISFEKYYNKCEPVQCTYTVLSRNDALFIVTTVISLFGGLVTIFKIIVPRIMNVFMKCIRRERGTIEPKVRVQGNMSLPTVSM